MKIDDPKILFERWFEAAFEKLATLPKGDGGIAGLMIALPLFERYVHHRKKQLGWTSFYQVMAHELLLCEASEAEEFWTVFRHGFCHTGMPFEQGKKKLILPKVTLSGNGPALPEKLPIPGGPHVFLLDPWKFIAHVRDIYRKDPALLSQNDEAPLMPIHVPEGRTEEEAQYVARANVHIGHIAS
jgi:hypothetical protein